MKRTIYHIVTKFKRWLRLLQAAKHAAPQRVQPVFAAANAGGGQPCAPTGHRQPGRARLPLRIAAVFAAFAAVLGLLPQPAQAATVASYEWDDRTTGSSINVSQAGTYSVTLTITGLGGETFFGGWAWMCDGETLDSGTYTVTDVGNTIIAGLTVSDTNSKMVNGAQITLVLDEGLVDLNPAATINITDYIYTGAPTISSISPIRGPTAGGNAVVVTGTGFGSGATVSFGGASATGVVVNSPSKITCTAPAGTGTVNVTVTTPGGGPSGTASYTYYDVPTIASISPNSGPEAGGNTVTITGTGFVDGDTTVSFGGNAAADVSVSNATTLTCTAPAGTAGNANVTVATPGGTSGTASYAYVPVPAITGISPASGPVSGGNTVTITGTGFVVGDTTVSFGGNAATNVSVSNATTLTCKPPAGAGTVNVIVTTPGGTGGTASYAYTSAPSFTTQPKNAQVTAGETATFSAAAAGAPAPTLQWQKSSDGANWTDIAGATSDSLTLADVTPADSGTQYRCLATNSIQANVPSNAATLTVAPVNHDPANPPQGGIDPTKQQDVTLTFPGEIREVIGADMNGQPYTLQGLGTDSITGYAGSTLAFDARPGSVVLTLYASYLQTLPDGDYTLMLYFADGAGSVDFTVARETAAASVTMYTIDASASGNGSLNASGRVATSAGTDRTFYFTPAAGERVASVKVDGKTVQTDGKTYTFRNVQANHTFHVAFTTGGVSSSPKTGDSAGLNGWLALLMAGGVVLIGAVRYRKRAKQS